MLQKKKKIIQGIHLIGELKVKVKDLMLKIKLEDISQYHWQIIILDWISATANINLEMKCLSQSSKTPADYCLLPTAAIGKKVGKLNAAN